MVSFGLFFLLGRGGGLDYRYAASVVFGLLAGIMVSYLVHFFISLGKRAR